MHFNDILILIKLMKNQLLFLQDEIFDIANIEITNIFQLLDYYV